jgi:hypothetical protein
MYARYSQPYIQTQKSHVQQSGQNPRKNQELNRCSDIYVEGNHSNHSNQYTQSENQLEQTQLGVSDNYSFDTSVVGKISRSIDKNPKVTASFCYFPLQNDKYWFDMICTARNPQAIRIFENHAQPIAGQHQLKSVDVRGFCEKFNADLLEQKLVANFVGVANTANGLISVCASDCYGYLIREKHQQLQSITTIHTESSKQKPMGISTQIPQIYYHCIEEQQVKCILSSCDLQKEPYATLFKQSVVKKKPLLALSEITSRICETENYASKDSALILRQYRIIR